MLIRISAQTLLDDNADQDFNTDIAGGFLLVRINFNTDIAE